MITRPFMFAFHCQEAVAPRSDDCWVPGALRSDFRGKRGKIPSIGLFGRSQPLQLYVRFSLTQVSHTSRFQFQSLHLFEQIVNPDALSANLCDEPFGGNGQLHSPRNTMLSPFWLHASCFYNSDLCLVWKTRSLSSKLAVRLWKRFSSQATRIEADVLRRHFDVEALNSLLTFTLIACVIDR